MTGKKSRQDSPSSTQPSSELKLSKFQGFETITIDRRKIKNAPYNPRTIDKQARAKLLKSLKKIKLVQPVVWNVRTGNLVGGHQRLSVLDDLEGSQEYLLTVARVDVDDKTEREINIALNNQSIQGAWDEELLENLLKESEALGAALEAELMGFDDTELKSLLGQEIFGGLDHTATTKDKEVLDKIAGAKERSREKEATDNDANHYLVVVFTTTGRMNAFRRALKLPADEQYVDGEKMAAAAGVNLDVVNG